MTGGEYDLIAPDPRGTGGSLPVNCYPDNNLERTINGLVTPAAVNSSETALGTAWSYTKQFTARCKENIDETGALMSTAFVARDFMQITDALTNEGGDGLLRYWGIFSAVFIEKLGR